MSQSRVGLLAESLLFLGRPLYLGASDPDGFQALRDHLDARGVSYVAVPVEQVIPAVVIIADAPFSAPHHPAFDAALKTHGEVSRQLSGIEAACALLVWSHVSGAGAVVMSPAFDALNTLDDAAADRLAAFEETLATGATFQPAR